MRFYARFMSVCHITALLLSTFLAVFRIKMKGSMQSKYSIFGKHALVIYFTSRPLMSKTNFYFVHFIQVETLKRYLFQIIWIPRQRSNKNIFYYYFINHSARKVRVCNPKNRDVKILRTTILSYVETFHRAFTFIITDKPILQFIWNLSSNHQSWLTIFTIQYYLILIYSRTDPTNIDHLVFCSPKCFVTYRTKRLF